VRRLQHVPKQQNGYDCGVYVIKFAQALLALQPTTTPQDKESAFQIVNNESLFSQMDVDNERMRLNSTIRELARRWRKVPFLRSCALPLSYSPIHDTVASSLFSSLLFSSLLFSLIRSVTIFAFHVTSNACSPMHTPGSSGG
jgi:hypothetical protein